MPEFTERVLLENFLISHECHFVCFLLYEYVYIYQARVSPESEHFLVNPLGLTYAEIAASSLIKVDIKGDVIEAGSTNLGAYKTGFSVHAAIHQARPDIKCVVHLLTPAAVAVSFSKLESFYVTLVVHIVMSLW